MKYLIALLMLISFNVNATELVDLSVKKAYESDMGKTCRLNIDIDAIKVWDDSSKPNEIVRVNLGYIRNGNFGKGEWDYSHVRETFEQNTYFSESDTYIQPNITNPIKAGKRKFYLYTTCLKLFGKQSKPQNVVEFEVVVPNTSPVIMTVNSKGLISIN